MLIVRNIFEVTLVLSCAYMYIKLQFTCSPIKCLLFLTTWLTDNWNLQIVQGHIYRCTTGEFINNLHVFKYEHNIKQTYFIWNLCLIFVESTPQNGCRQHFAICNEHTTKLPVYNTKITQRQYWRSDFTSLFPDVCGEILNAENFGFKVQYFSCLINSLPRMPTTFTVVHVRLSPQLNTSFPQFTCKTTA
jgi:hypothetical protein